jgi:hypothetical protein
LAPTLSDAGASGVTPILARQIVNASIAANAINAPVVLGSSTTVPTNALSVRISVSVSLGKANGALIVFPNGTTSSGIAPALTWEAGQAASTSIVVGVGTANKIAFKNASTGTVKVLAKVTGWTGAGQPEPGDVLSGADDGSAEWTEPGIELLTDQRSNTRLHPQPFGFAVGELYGVARGYWSLEFTSDIFNDGAGIDQVTCELRSSGQAEFGYRQSVLVAAGTTQTLEMRDLAVVGPVTNLTVVCWDTTDSATAGKFGPAVMMATRVTVPRGALDFAS